MIEEPRKFSIVVVHFNLEFLFPFSVSNMHRENLIKKLLLTHDSDGRRLDSEAILLAVGNIMFHSSKIIVIFMPLDTPFMQSHTIFKIIGDKEFIKLSVA